ncbi:MAG: acyl carrier protein [Gammaproteobacteria bacterium]
MNEIKAKIHRIFADDLDLEASADTDLLATGLLDSMSLVELLVRLETVFGLKIPVADLDFDSFRTISDIATFVAERGPQLAQLIGV